MVGFCLVMTARRNSPEANPGEAMHNRATLTATAMHAISFLFINPPMRMQAIIYLYTQLQRMVNKMAPKFDIRMQNQ
jgi:hypothetical protein